MIRKWKEISSVEKIITVLSIIICISIVVLAFLQIFDVFESSMNFLIILLGVNMFLQAYTQYKSGNRGVAIFSLAVGIFMCVCEIIILVIP